MMPVEEFALATLNVVTPGGVIATPAGAEFKVTASVAVPVGAVIGLTFTVTAEPGPVVELQYNVMEVGFSANWAACTVPAKKIRASKASANVA